MSARDAILTEIEVAPESLLREAYDFILFLKTRQNPQDASATVPSSAAKPDFLARQKALFGDREVPDSEAILSELRAERF